MHYSIVYLCNTMYYNSRKLTLPLSLCSYRWQLKFQYSWASLNGRGIASPNSSLGHTCIPKDCVAILLVHHYWLFTLFLNHKVHGSYVRKYFTERYMDACSYTQPWPYLYSNRRHDKATYILDLLQPNSCLVLHSQTAVFLYYDGKKVWYHLIFVLAFHWTQVNADW